MDEKIIYLDFGYRCEFCDGQAGSKPIFLNGESVKLCSTCFGNFFEGWAKNE
jgi:hypothetical protein